MDWSKIINEVLEHNGFSQSDLHRYLVKKVKISIPYLSELQSGKKTSPSFGIGLEIIKMHPQKNEYLN